MLRNVHFHKVLKGFGLMTSFDGNDQCRLSGTVAASGIPGATHTRISNVFERGPCGIQWGSRDPLRSGEGFGWDLTFKMFIFTRFYKGFGLKVRFRWQR